MTIAAMNVVSTNTMSGYAAVRTVAVIPAFNCEDTVAMSVAALIGDPRVYEVIVVDDGSVDATSANASVAGARVIRLARNSGKDQALSRGFLEAGDADVLLMVDADTGSSAAAALALIEPIAGGRADMVIGVLPGAGAKGGFGIVRDFAAWCIEKTSGFESAAPLSGQRALTRTLLEACSPLAQGYAVDAFLTARAISAGFTVLELPVDMTHEHRGRSLKGFAHRARQGLHIARAFIPLLARPRRSAKGL